MSFSRLIANQTDTLRNQPCKLNRIIITKKGASSNIMTIWNGSATTGNIVCQLDTTTAVGTIDFGGLYLSNGLTIVTGTGTAPEAIVVYDED